MEEQTDRLYHLIEDILVMAELDSGHAVQEWRPIALDSLLQSAAANSRAWMRAGHLTRKLSPVPAGMPQVYGDVRRLAQAVTELLENAATFTSEGGTLTVETNQVEEDGLTWVTFAVQDTGPGMTPKEQERAFDRFFRGKLAASGHIPGTGLGLSIARAIVEAHGGRLTVESAVGEGSTFTIWLRGESPA
jgi:signal transduction histidine kinase